MIRLEDFVRLRGDHFDQFWKPQSHLRSRQRGGAVCQPQKLVWRPRLWHSLMPQDLVGSLGISLMLCRDVHRCVICTYIHVYIYIYYMTIYVHIVWNTCTVVCMIQPHRFLCSIHSSGDETQLNNTRGKHRADWPSLQLISPVKLYTLVGRLPHLCYSIRVIRSIEYCSKSMQKWGYHYIQCIMGQALYTAFLLIQWLQCFAIESSGKPWAI